MSAATIEELSEPVDWKLAERLSNQTAVLIAGGLTPVTVAVLSFMRTGQAWYTWWGIAATVVLLCRLVLGAIFRSRRRVGRPTGWKRLFLIGAWSNGAICGIGGAGAVLESDAFTQMLAITMLTAFVMGSAARNATYPKAAVGSVLLAEIPLLLACLATRQIDYVVYTLFIALFSVSALSIVGHLYSQTVRSLVTDEANAALMCEVQRTNNELAAANANFAAANVKLAAMAHMDGLTGVPNRRHFDNAYALEVAAAKRDASNLSIIMFDIDVFKLYNDRYGHQMGDECLCRVARVLATGFRRPRDLFARYGGEEFIAILPQTSLPQAAAFAQTLRADVAALGLEHVASPQGIVTVSIGVATLSPDGTASAAELLSSADQALYAAKRAGRNRVHAMPDERLCRR